MRKVLLLTALFCLGCFTKPFGQKAISVAKPTCEYDSNPIGIEAKQPRLSWQLTSNVRNQVQAAYRIIVSGSPEMLASDKGNMWDSKKVKSEQSIQIEYLGKELLPTQKYYWKVKVWSKDGTESDWSEIAFWQMGLLSHADWSTAKWITMPELDLLNYKNWKTNEILAKTKNSLPQFRKVFLLTKPLKTATAFISGLGQFEMSLNGQKVGDHFLDPGWTNYEKYSLYVTFDITSQVFKGENTVGVMLGNGFYDVPKGRYRKADLVLMHGLPKMICKICIEYQDGTSEIIVSDETWKVTRNPITYGTIYGGEDYDATLEQEGWNKPGFNDASWKQAVVVKGNETIRSQRITPVKVMETLIPTNVYKSKKGKWVYDLGQNASGIVRFTVQGKRGDSISVFPGELMDSDSSVTQRNIGSPYCFSYKMKGTEPETWQPRFSYNGFRYVQLENGVPEGQDNPLGLPVIKNLVGLHTRNSAKSVGSFSCSSDLFNKTDKLIDWGIKSNMASVLTDCPHREKLGWLEQTYLMGSSVQYNYDISRMFTKTIEDMQATQLENGLVPAIAPEYCIFNNKEGKPTDFRDSPEWGSAYVILPWYMYQWYGDKRLLETNYDGMKKYVEYLGSKAKNYIVSHGLGDWYDLGPKLPGYSQLTSMGVTGTASWYYDVNIITSVAKLLGKKDDVAKYSQLAGEIKNAFNRTYFRKDSFCYDRNSQTANAMAIYMGLTELPYKGKVLESLIKGIRDNKNALTVGDIGYRYLLQVLEDNGASNVIFDMNSHSDVPGYGYQLAKGATALTESWQALPTVSNNHLMLGHLMEWFYSGLAGIRQDENSAAYKNIIIKPNVVGNIMEAKASYESMYGIIKSEWKRQGTTFELTVQIPVNTTAIVYLPTATALSSSITEGGNPVGSDIQFLRKENDRLLYKIGSGVYVFKVK